MFSEMSLARGYLVNCFKFKVDSIKYLFYDFVSNAGDLFHPENCDQHGLYVLYMILSRFLKGNFFFLFFLGALQV